MHLKTISLTIILFISALCSAQSFRVKVVGVEKNES